MKKFQENSLKTKLIDIILNNSSALVPVSTGLAPDIVKLHNIKCILFDVYGTLFISGAGDISHSSKELLHINMINLLTSYHFTINDAEAGKETEELFYHFIKLSHKKDKQNGKAYPEVDVVEIWRSVLNELKNAGKISGHLNEEELKAFALNYEVSKNPVWPMPHLEKIFSCIKNKGLLSGIISNAQFFTPLLFEAFMNKDLNALGFNKELLCWSYDQKLAKPSPALFINMSETLRNNFSILPQEVLYIGNDMLNDIKPAYEAGFRTVLFAGDKRSLRTREDLPECKRIKPDAIITDLIRLCEIIE